MFEHLGHFDKVLVAGPQRSGTRICAKAIAHDTKLKYIDERTFGGVSREQFEKVFNSSHNVVIQCPAMSHCIEEFDAVDVAILFMHRDIDDIIASQERIGWPCEKAQLAKYGLDEGIISKVRYAHWENYQKPLIQNAFDIMYTDLESHPLWVPKEQREDFKWQQTEII